MNRPKVFIDGKEGTTGLQIYDRLSGRDDIELLLIDEDKRKDPEERKRFLNAADLVFLCLPDAAAKEAVSMVENPSTKIIDASTAHRTAPGWTYGFPELTGQRQRIKQVQRVANPGCHATGFLASAAPLVQLGVLPRDYPVACYSLTGYSGGGKKMIAEYESENRPSVLDAPNIYGLELNHKHLPEMKAVAGLLYPPVFSPILGDMYQGMATTILLHNRLLPGTPKAQDICEVLAGYYEDSRVISVASYGSVGPRISASELAGKDTLMLCVTGNGEQTMVTALFDNLGKGASGAAVQNMNLMLGFDEIKGLNLA